VPVRLLTPAPTMRPETRRPLMLSKDAGQPGPAARWGPSRLRTQERAGCSVVPGPLGNRNITVGTTPVWKNESAYLRRRKMCHEKFSKHQWWTAHGH